MKTEYELTGADEALLISLRHELHRHAELSGAEHRTKKLLMEFLRDHTEFSVTERAEYEDELDALDRALCEKARQLAARDGLTVFFAESDRFPATVNDDTCISCVYEAALAVTGEPPVEMAELWRASEDFGWYTKACPGAIFYIGGGEDCPALHTEDYDFPDVILPTAVRIFRAILAR